MTRLFRYNYHEEKKNPSNGVFERVQKFEPVAKDILYYRQINSKVLY